MLVIEGRRGGQRRDSRTRFGGYPTPEAYVDAIGGGVSGRGKQTYEGYQGLEWSYPRSGDKALGDFENSIARLLRLREGQRLFATNSGMSSVVAAIEITNPSRGDIVIHGNSGQEYGKTGSYFSDLTKRGVTIQSVNAGDSEAIDRQLQKVAGQHVHALFFETVGNGPEMPVLDLEKLAKSVKDHNVKPDVIVIDNTLPQNSTINLSEFIVQHPDLPIVVVESMTKYYTDNEDIGGFAFVGNDILAEQFYNKRTAWGWTPSKSFVEKFSGIAEKDPDEFAAEIRQTMNNTQRLAQAAAAVAGHGKKFVVGYPGIAGHPNSANVQENYPDGVSPLFFISPTPKAGITGEELFQRLFSSRGFGGVDITESFGFGSMTVSLNKGVIRVSGGLETDLEIIKQQVARLTRSLAIAFSR